MSTTPEQWFVAALAITTLAAGLLALAQAARGGSARSGFDRLHAAAVLVLALVALAARALLVRPALLHANFHGAALVDAILAFPRPASHRAEYGQGSFLVLGALAHLTGGGFEGVVAVNRALGVATLVLLGVLGARLSGRATAVPIALLLGALDPTLMRVTASEDAHTLATFLAAVALVSLDVGAIARSRAALGCGVAAAVLMLWTRQTLIPVAALAASLAWFRADTATRRWSWLRAALAIVALALVVRVVQTARHPTDGVTLRFLPIVLANRPGSLFAGHPLLDPRAAPALLLFGLLGLASLRRRPDGVVLAAGLFGLLLVTLPFAFPTPGVELSFRMPAVALWLIPAAIGASRLPPIARLPRAGVLLVAPLALLPLVLPSFANARATTAPTEELGALHALRAQIPPGATLVEIASAEPAPSFHLPRFALPPEVIIDRGTKPRGDRFLVAGLQCRGRSFAELVPGATPEMLLARDFRRGPGATSRVDPRPECKALLAGAALVSPVIPIAAPDDPPFAFFGADRAPVTVSLWRLTRGP